MECFTPTYLFLILNSIIVTIVVTSKMDHIEPGGLQNKMKTAETEAYANDQSIDYDIKHMTFDSSENTPEPFSLDANAGDSVAERFVHEQPPLSESNYERKDRHGSLSTKDAKFSKAGDTLEEIWTAIADKRHPNSSLHQLRACKSLENDKIICRAPTLFSKAATFSESSSRPSFQVDEPMDLGSSTLQRDPSLSVDELNKKAEEFISKFNKEIRLQRQESLMQNMQSILMVDTAAMA